MTVRVLVIQHEDDCPVGMIEPWLAAEGLECDILPAHQGRAVPAALVEHVGLIVLGGQMGADDDREHRWLTPTKALIASTASAGLPFLGVCLGHQLAASALGGEVVRNPGGALHTLAPFAATDEGRVDALTSALPTGTPVLHWNNDIVTRLPRGSSLLATAPDGTPQAVRFGRRAWGVQFHPEVGADIVASWSPGPDPQAEAATIAQLRTRQAELHRPWEILLRRFAQLTLRE
ncbi:type 1 glutamine amidotransferase [Ornithinimicrobium panacihumi]|uniref:type 1 glutamine amidotransferase n=1 Tax=Ornithinimicrobium panacihumi TaxID=2008449 RepID=UPI003F8B6E9C